MAFEKLDVPEEVIKSVLAEANRVGLQESLKATEPLLEYPDIFSQEQIQAYASRKREETTSGFLNERIAGKHNTRFSRQPGLVALLKHPGYEKLQDIFNGSSMASLFGITFEPAETNAAGEKLMILRAPEGSFEELDRRNAIRFYDTVQALGVSAVRPTESSTTSGSLPAVYVVTIAGDAGEYWQNPQLNLDGSRK